MAYTPPDYPAAIPDEVTDLPDRLDDIDWIEAARYNELKKEIVAIMTELGTDPAGASTDVKTRLALLALIADPTFTGDATIPTIDLTGGQIKFPASQDASSDPNTQDDYEEGTWTPAYSPHTGAFTTLTYTRQVGKYIKVGNKVILTCDIRVNAFDVGTGTAEIHLDGLPFNMGGSTAEYGSGQVALVNGWTTQAPNYLSAGDTVSYMFFRYNTATGFSAVAPANIAAGCELQATIIIFIS